MSSSPDLIGFDYAALLAIGRYLKTAGYAFTTPTPLTIDRVNARPENAFARSIIDVFGWNRTFREGLIQPELFDLMTQAGILEQSAAGWRSRVRFSSLAGQVYAHSGYPTAHRDSVFFGPDTYRFVRLVKETLIRRQWRPSRLIDICCGCGAGALATAALLPPTGSGGIILSDINHQALRFAALNAALNDQPQATTVHSDLFEHLAQADLIIANPPYLIDTEQRTYRDGGGALGLDLSLRIVTEAIPHLASGGSLILYTGSPIVDGTDQLAVSLEMAMASTALRYTYEELDPDVFGEELIRAEYSHVDRIALVSVVVDAH